MSVVCEGGNRSARPPDMLRIVRGTDSLFCNRRVDIHEDALGAVCALVVVVALCVAAFVGVRGRCGWRRRRVVARAAECVGRCSRRITSIRSVHVCIDRSAVGWAVRSELGAATGECGV